MRRYLLNPNFISSIRGQLLNLGVFEGADTAGLKTSTFREVKEETDSTLDNTYVINTHLYWSYHAHRDKTGYVSKFSRHAPVSSYIFTGG